MFSKELEQSISNLFDEAQKSNIEYITIEHLLLMILNDFDVKESLLSCDVNIENLKTQISDHIKETTPIKNNHEEASFVAKNAKGFILSNYSEDNFKFSFKKLFDTV